MAAKKPHTVTAPHGAQRQDEYYWLRDDTRKNEEMLGYLKAENAYTDGWMAPLAPLKDRLLKEYVARIKQDDDSVPVLDRGYYYYSRFSKGADYPVIARRKGSMRAPEQVLFDQPKMAEGTTYFSIGDYEVSDDNRIAAYAEDNVGRRQYVIRFKDIATGKLLSDEIANAEPNIVWLADNKTVYYVEKDPVTLLSKRIKSHRLGTPASDDKLVYEEKDDSFYISLVRTTGRKYVCVMASATVMSEQRCTSASVPSDLVPLSPRRKDHLYWGDEAGDRWVVRSNKDSANYQLYRFAVTDLGKGEADWAAMTPASKSDFIDDFAAFDDHVAIAERSGGNKRIRVLTDAGKSTVIGASEPAFTMMLTGNRSEHSDWVRYGYASLVQPAQTIEYNVRTGAKRVLKTQPTPGYDPKSYVSERLWIDARDGTKVPVSLVYKKGFKKDGSAAMLQYAYGSYGASTDPAYSTTVTSLLDRGMVYAIAHIRGGQDLGRQWYDDGHLQKKINSFTDFIDVTRALVSQGYAAKDRVAAMGGSAGGLLMGGVTNMAPQDYKVVINLVPFVDVLTTMLDPSIPLTTNEYDEWGNPERAADYAWMAAYSPYDNIKRQAYPSIWVGTGLWDSQVQYYEPTKYVARLRATKTDSNPLLFRVNMDSGHGGKSGRFRRYEEQAEYGAFMLNQLGINK
ncbi:S9 family peptidase [Sphingomonas jaspsi]|uniref:S9 family peptidase n=1 Tax=Sphingomonas jaspsi TaxID=392409 RepID=UPI0004B810D6|nr:S9 family peptidase [Sphingomonas jaspsi]